MVKSIYHCGTDEQLPPDFLEILKHSLQNSVKILKKWFLVTILAYGTTITRAKINQSVKM